MNVIEDYGRIFIPQDYELEYAKSPQAVVFDDFVRIYFCYCVPDGVKLISRVGFADLSLSGSRIFYPVFDVCGNPVSLLLQ